MNERIQILKSTEGEYVENRIIPRLRLGEADVRIETIQHHINRYNLAAQHVQPESTTVDLCCGTGYGTDILKKAGAKESIGVDLSEEAINYASSSYSDSHYINDSVIDFLDAVPDTYRPNVVTFFEAIEHIPREDGEQVLDAVRNAIASNGYFFLSTPRDIRSDVNPDHITQWEFEDLKIALESRFEAVEMMGQDWATGEFTLNDQSQSSFFVAKCSQPIR